MQVLFKNLQLTTKPMQGFKRYLIAKYNSYSEGRTRARNAKYYKQHPEKYKQVIKIRKELDFSTIKAPFHLPLKTRWIYKPDLKEDLYHTNVIDFEAMSGNHILLYLEHPQHLPLSDVVKAIYQLTKRDPSNKLDLFNHEWVKNSLEHLTKQIIHMTHEDIIRTVVIHYRFGNMDPEFWRLYEKNIKEKYLETLKVKGFVNLFIVAFKDEGIRFSQEFKDDLIAYLPKYLRIMPMRHFGTIIQTVWDNKYMNEYLWDRHFHQLIWKRANMIAQDGGLPQALDVLIAKKYEHDEFMYPDLYKKLLQCCDKVKHEHLQSLSRALIRMFKAFPSHGQYQIVDIIRKLQERESWESTLGNEAKDLNLIKMVQTDLAFYRERETVRAENNHI